MSSVRKIASCWDPLFSMEKELSQQLLRICSFSILSTCQCDSLFPANPHSHQRPICVNFWHLVIMFFFWSQDPPNYPQVPCTFCFLLTLPGGHRLSRTLYPVPRAWHHAPLALTREEDAFKVQLKEKANLPVLQVEHILPTPRSSFPNLNS